MDWLIELKDRQWKKTKRVTVAQRIERQPHLKKHLDPKGTLKPKSIISKYYRHRKQNKLPAHEESPAESVFKDASATRKKGHIKRYYQDIPKTITFEDYWEIYKDEILKKIKEYPVSKVQCTIRINMQRVTPTTKGPIEVIRFESIMEVITDGMDMDEFYDMLHKEIREKVEKHLKNGSGWTIVNCE